MPDPPTGLLHRLGGEGATPHDVLCSLGEGGARGLRRAGGVPSYLRVVSGHGVADFTSGGLLCRTTLAALTHLSVRATTTSNLRNSPLRQCVLRGRLTPIDSATVCGSLATKVAALPAAGAHELRVARALAPLGPVGAARVGVHAGHRRWRALGWLLRRGRPHGA